MTVVVVSAFRDVQKVEALSCCFSRLCLARKMAKKMTTITTVRAMQMPLCRNNSTNSAESLS